MAGWHIGTANLKKYPHFDPVISTKEATALAENPLRVAGHAFYPFILYEQRWTRFAKSGELGKPKTRPIRYAARADAYIFSKYRHLLSTKYEAELLEKGLDASIIAYRRISDDQGFGGKCNIHFARDAFNTIRLIGNCFVICMDISSFFESIDHSFLKTLWCRLLDVGILPPDHFRVFNAITSYAVVKKQSVYQKLGHFGPKQKTKSGEPINGYLTPFGKMPKQLCSGAEFRLKIAGGDGSKSLIKKNFKKYGIPQGAPISDLLANLSLLNFDVDVLKIVSESGGRYYRYSDDILIIGAGNESAGTQVMADIAALIKKSGPKLSIKPSKSSVFVFTQQADSQTFKLIRGEQGKNGLEYLGFRYDGRSVYVRDSTLSNLRRKIAHASKVEAYRHVKRYPNQDFPQLELTFNYQKLTNRFGKVEDFGELSDDYRNWTFWTYAWRASEVFGHDGKTILRQLKKHNLLIRRRARFELERAVSRRSQL